MTSLWFKARTGSAIAVLSLVLAVIAAGSSLAAVDSTVKVKLWNKNDGSQGITLTPAKIKAGKVTFEVKNISTNLEHELMFDRTNLAPDQLPTMPETAKVDEGKLKHFHEFGDLSPGESHTWTADLKPGRYIMFCNEVGHFGAGMHTILTVTP